MQCEKGQKILQYENVPSVIHFRPNFIITILVLYGIMATIDQV